MRLAIRILLISAPMIAWAGESAPWMGRPVKDLEAIQGPPDTVIPAWVCQYKDEFLTTYGYDRDKFLEGSVYSKATICSSDAARKFHDIYIYRQPAIHQRGQRLYANFHVSVDEEERIVSYGASFSPPCNVNFDQWMQGDVVAECFF